MTDSSAFALDTMDYRILRELGGDGRASDVALSDRVNLSSTAVARRRKALEESGAIQGYSADFDFAKLGFGIVVIVMIELSSQAEQALVEFESAVIKCPSMSYCSFISGNTDFLMIVHVRSFEDYDRVYRSELSMLPHVAKIRSSFVMREVTRRNVPPAVLAGRAAG
ncbi:Lrp/AsnC family transcriptional regulator [Sphingomonas sp. 28-63-12]|uniref:Lrp/AsnC family transcriptional regulator n=1 Tax=Sphingomonas sp. 28-63-12 TaxID=1970434 RepID=UPI0035A9A73C